MQAHRTLTETLAALEARGYTDQFRAEPGGLRASVANKVLSLDELAIEETVRVEDTSDPDNQVMVLALVSQKGGVRGTYVVPHGPSMHPLDVEAIQKLK